MSHQKTAALWCHTEYPVVQNVRRALQMSGEWTLKEITRPIHMVNVQEAKAVLEGCDVACLFIPTNDLSAAPNVTQTFLTTVEEAGVPRVIWVAPIGSDTSDIGPSLERAASSVQAHEKPSLIVRHGILFSELQRHREEIRGRNTLSLPMSDTAPLWVSPEDVAEIVVRGLESDEVSQAPIILGMKETGHGLARTLSEQLAMNLKGDRFAERRFKAIDVDEDGNLTRAELAPHMAELGYGPGEIDMILDNADINKDGTIDFDEYVSDMGGQLDRMLTDATTEVLYMNVPEAAFLYDMTVRGMDETAAHQYLALYKQTEAEGTAKNTERVETWLGHPLTSAAAWMDEHILEFLSVYILPGKGVLSIQEGHFAGRKARIIRLSYPSGRTLLGRRAFTNEAAEFRWSDVDPDEVETIRYTEIGADRTLELMDNRLVGLYAKGDWPGLRWAIPLLFNESQLPDWQIELFRETGQLQIEQEVMLGSPDDIICNCTGTTRRTLTELINSGVNTLDAIAQQTQVTTICGGCRPLVREMLGDSSWTPIHISEKIQISDRVYTYRMIPDNKALKPGNPGQHVVIQADIDGRLVQRAYTISSAASETRYREITVQREPQGQFSNWLFDERWREAGVRISDPQGGYFADLSRPNPIVCLVGGIGMAPALAMCRSVIQSGTGQRLYIDFCDSSWDQILYADELREAAATHPNIYVNLRVTREHGRLSANDIRQISQQYPDTSYYICGPKPYQDAVESYLQDENIPEDRINVEEFTPLTPQTTTEPTAEVATTTGNGYMYLGLFLLLAFAAQEALQIKWPWLETLQMGESYQRWSGLFLSLYIVAQFILPVMRARGNVQAVARHHRLHKLQGAFAPLVYYIHTTGLGYAYLMVLSIVYFANFLLGIFNQDIIRDPDRKQRFLHYWLAPHVGLSILTVALVIYHIYVVFAGLDRRIGHLASMSPQKNERLTPIKG